MRRNQVCKPLDSFALRITISYSPTLNLASTVTPKLSAFFKRPAGLGAPRLAPLNACLSYKIGLQGSSSKYSTKRGALKASNLSIIFDFATLTCSFFSTVGTGTTIAKSLTSP